MKNGAINDILFAREEKSRLQLEALKESECVIGLGLNIPGGSKRTAEAVGCVLYASEIVYHKLNACMLLCSAFRFYFYPGGCFGIASVNADAEDVKRVCVSIEEELSFGRLLDVDIIGSNGVAISRNVLGHSKRLCFCCDRPAVECGRAKAHSYQELRSKVSLLFQAFLESLDKTTIGAKYAIVACMALAKEVILTPKPGLVDSNDSGAHKDMDIETFMKSIAAIYPYLKNIEAEMTDAEFRQCGIACEKAMMSATGGINTHRGSIFILGHLIRAIKKYGELPDSEECIREYSRDVGKAELIYALESDSSVTKTHGQEVYSRTKITGIRGELASGLPTIFKLGLPLLEEKGELSDADLIRILFSIISNLDDSTIISRTDLETLRKVQDIARSCSNLEDSELITITTTLNIIWSKRRISPGGSADILAACMCLLALKKGCGKIFHS